MKKTLCILLTVILLTISLAGCVSNLESPPQIPVKPDDDTVKEPEETPDPKPEDIPIDTPVPEEKPNYDLNQFTVIYPKAEAENATAFLNQIRSYAPTAQLQNDQSPITAKEILYGTTNRPESLNAEAQLPADKDYVIAFYENKIVLYGRTSENLAVALLRFIDEYVRFSTDGVLSDVKVGTIVLGKDFSSTPGLSDQSFRNYPRFPKQYSDSHLCANNEDHYFYTNISAVAVEDYIKTMKDADFAMVQDRTANKNRSVTFLGMGGSVHLFYQESEKTLTLATNNGTPQQLKKPTEGSWQKLGPNSFAVMTMDYSKYTCGAGCNPRYDNNGLCYVITLEDGRFIVYDGGYSNANDAEIIYEFLTAQNKREGQPVIAAWVFTHSHGDHYGAFSTFTSTHAKDVTIEALVMNTGRSACYSGGHNNYLESMPELAKKNYPTANIIQLHVGQSLYFGNLEIEALYAHEMFHFDSRNLGDENTASLVTRVWIDGVSILLTGDSYAGDALTVLYGSYLKSDFFQTPHHATGGGSKNLYLAADPDYILWTTSQPGFRRRTYGQSYSVGLPSASIAKLNKQMFEEVGGTRESIDANGAINNWCADGPVEIMTFDQDKKIHITYYNIREELLPNNPIEEWNAPFVSPDQK